MGLKIIGSPTPFRDRQDAAGRLAESLGGEVGENALVLGIPRGGVVIAAVIARELGAELDVIIARKLSAPGNPELAIGAILEDGGAYLNRDLIETMGVDEAHIEQEKEQQLKRIRRRVEAYRAVRPIAPREGRNLVVVDDGVATGATMAAALRGLRAVHPAGLCCAVPVGPEDTLQELNRLADEVVCLAAPVFFQAVGQFYERFEQVEDAEVVGLLERAKRS